MNALARLRAQAQKIDADFERRERRASAEVRAIRYRDAVEASRRLLDRPIITTAPTLCAHCLDTAHEKKP